MVRMLSTANATALAARQLVARDFLWIEARNRTTGAPEMVGFWSDVGDKSAFVLDPETGSPVERNFYGAGTLIGIDDIPLVSNLTVQSVTITMSQIDELVAQAVRDYDIKQAKVEIFRGLFDPDTRLMVDTAYARFVGFVDEVNISTPSENEAGSVTIVAMSHTQEVTRSNPEYRSHESQILRSDTDNFFADVSVVGEWEHFWGRAGGTLT